MKPFYNTPYPVQWVFGILSLISHLFIKKNPKRIVLTSFHGKGYRGNTKVIFEKLIEQGEFHPVWLSTSSKVIDDIRRLYGRKYAFKIHSFQGLWCLGQSAALLFTHGTSDFPFMYLPRRSVRIQTYHGLPTKKGEFLRPVTGEKPGFIHNLILNYRFKPISYFLSSSPIVTQIYSSRFGLPQDRFLETGYPAYDELIKNENSAKSLEQIIPEALRSDHLILYAPTFRKKEKTRWFPFEDFNLEEIARFLEINRVILAFRAHPNEQLKVDQFQKISPRFVDASQEKVEDINTLINHTDVIITDYSSVYLEGLLKDIPVLFIPYDIHTYERGLPLPYDKVTPGPKVDTQSQFLISLQEALTNPKYRTEERGQVRDLFFSKPDGQSTDRVIRFLEENI